MCPLFVCVGEISGRQESLSLPLCLSPTLSRCSLCLCSVHFCKQLPLCLLLWPVCLSLLFLCALNSSDPAMFVFVFMLNERAGASARNPTNLHSLSLSLSRSLSIFMYVYERAQHWLIRQQQQRGGRAGWKEHAGCCLETNSVVIFSQPPTHIHTHSHTHTKLINVRPL